MDRIPFILYGDGPRLQTGLARIARDLATHLVFEAEDLGIQFAQVGVDDPGGWHWVGWDFAGFQPNPQDQGRAAVEDAIFTLTEACGRRPVVLMIMDPARCYDLTRAAPFSAEDRSRHRLAASFWGYYPIDAENHQGALGGPAAVAVHATNRLLGYGRYGAGVLKQTLLGADLAHIGAISYLPHGIDTHVFHPGVPLDAADTAFHTWTAQTPPDALKIGCVATNQPRKDLGLLVETLAVLKTQGYPIACWLHTDLLTRAWDIGELARSCGLQRGEIAVTTTPLTDAQLAARYNWSDCTIAPGLGEGFGYPIVESLACGTPCVHGDYAGGADLIPCPAWKVPVQAWRLESVYAVRRPVFAPEAVAWAVTKAVASRVDRAGQIAYCRGSVAHLDWEELWPRWRSWITQGLHEERQHGQRGTRESVQEVDRGTPEVPVVRPV